MNKKVIIIGAGGQGKVIADIIKCNRDEVIGFLDDHEIDQLNEYSVLGKVNDAPKFMNQEYYFIVAIGNARIRKQIIEKLRGFGARLYIAIHPSSVIANDVIIGEGCAVMANVVINSCSSIGVGCIINTSSTVDHDCNIMDYVHVAPGSHLSGTVSVCEGTWLGVGSIVSNNLRISGGNTDNPIMIGAGAVVVHDINCSGTYVGLPARKVIHHE